MKKSVLISCLSLAALILFIGIYMLFNQTNPVVQVENPPIIAQKYIYVLKETQGSLCLYSFPENIYIKKYDEIHLYLLPQSDQELLKEGVQLQDEAELERLLEDLGL